MATNDQLAESLKKSNYSLTKARQTVFSQLKDREPQTVNEIVTACHGAVDRASVYRSIKLFESLGIVQRMQIGWKYKLELSDKFHTHHHHLTCLNCGRTFALKADPKLEQRLKQLSNHEDFEMQGHQLEIQGLCQKCT